MGIIAHILRLKKKSAQSYSLWKWCKSAELITVSPERSVIWRVSQKHDGGPSVEAHFVHFVRVYIQEPTVMFYVSLFSYT